MNAISSLQGLARIWADDRKFQTCGLPFGWYLRFFYTGRWHLRQGKTPPEVKMRFKVHSKQVELTLSAAYAGALKGVFLDHEYDCLGQMGEQPPRRILDLGANIGMGTIYMNTLFHQAEFICVEPDPRSLPLLEKNLQGNGIQAKIVRSAVGAAAGQLKLRFGLDPTCSSLETTTLHNLGNAVTVPIRTVDEILAESQWSEVDILKMDIEGAEEDLLSSGPAWLKRVKTIILEIHPNTTEQRIASYLKPFGFTLTRVGWKTEPVYLARRAVTT